MNVANIKQVELLFFGLTGMEDHEWDHQSGSACRGSHTEMVLTYTMHRSAEVG